MNKFLIYSLLMMSWAWAKPLMISNQEYAPYMGERLVGGGILTTIVSHIFAKMKVDVRYAYYPNNRAIEMVTHGDVDASIGWTPTQERQRTLYFSDEILPFNMTLFHRKETVLTWYNLHDLTRYRFGATLGNFYSETFETLQKRGKLKVDYAIDDATNFRKLVIRRIDVFPMEREAGHLTRFWNLTPKDAATIVAEPKPYWSTPLCLVIYKKTPNAEKLIKDFNKILNEMKKNGELTLMINDSRERVYRGLYNTLR